MATRLAVGPDATRSSSLVGQRTWFHLVYRLLVRAYQGLSVRVDHNSPPWLRWVPRIGAVWDLAGAALLRRSRRFALAPRLALDSLDTALWSLAPRQPDDSPTLVGVPLAAEAGLRMGARGMVVPLVNAAVTAAVRHTRRMPLDVGRFSTQVVAVAIGSASLRYEEHWRRAILDRHARDLDARSEQAHLAGQNAIAMGADSAIDLLTRTTPLLTPGAGDPILRELIAGWKETLAEKSRANATYLLSAIQRWEAHHNNSADLHADVEAHIAEDHGTVLLSQRQAAWLLDALEDRHLRGRVAVSLARPDRARHINRPIALFVNGEPVTIPEDPSAGLEPFEVAAFIPMCQTAFFLATCLEGQAQAQLNLVVVPAVGSLALAAWSDRRIREVGSAAYGPLLLANLGVVLAQAVVATVTMRSTRTPSGLHRIPAIGALAGPAALASLYWRDLNLAYKVAAGCLAAATVAIGLALSPESVSLSDVIGESIWPISAALSAVRIPVALRAETARLDRALRHEAEERLRVAFEDGQALVGQLLIEAHAQACSFFASNRDCLDPRLAAEAQRRLEEVGAKVEVLSAGA